jgi:probable rRNA maturation factor
VAARLDTAPRASSGDGTVDDEFEVEIVDESSAAVALSAPRIQRLVRFVLCREGATGRWVVTVALTTDQQLQKLHRDFMGIDEPTDVMTFPYEPTDGPAGGDIAVSVERAAAQGPENGLDAVAEVEFLIAHGLLHLLGWDDAQANDRLAMLARQTALLADFERGQEGIGCRRNGGRRS